MHECRVVWKHDCLTSPIIVHDWMADAHQSMAINAEMLNEQHRPRQGNDGCYTLECRESPAPLPTPTALADAVLATEEAENKIRCAYTAAADLFLEELLIMAIGQIAGLNQTLRRLQLLEHEQRRNNEAKKV